MQTTNNRRALGLARHDKVWSEVHNSWVRFIGWVAGDFAEVADANTLKRLPDLVNLNQLSRTPRVK